ncbi:MAG: hypothetical protein MUF83_01580 [Acidimicrobiales bacterium]|jgi:hypothetical protein|nr:hypothetical protein [Acidimicrobiales bacterium]
MKLHPNIAHLLDPEARHAVDTAIELLDDLFLAGIAETLMADPDEPPYVELYTFLPPRYLDFYDLRLLRRWYICFLTVTERLANGWGLLRCRGEELALQAIIECAQDQLDIGIDEDDEIRTRFFRLEDDLFEDLDYLVMWQPELDGIDDPETAEGARMDMGPMHPRHWFEPFRDELPVHPLLA